MTEPTRAQRMRAIDYERHVVTLSIGKLRQTFYNKQTGIWKSRNIEIPVGLLETFVEGLDERRAELIASCETEGHDLAYDEAGFAQVCMVCGKTFEPGGDEDA